MTLNILLMKNVSLRLGYLPKIMGLVNMYRHLNPGLVIHTWILFQENFFLMISTGGHTYVLFIIFLIIFFGCMCGMWNLSS